MPMGHDAGVTVGGMTFHQAAYSRSEAAALLGCDLSTIIRRIDDGTLRSVKLGRRVLVPAAEIARLLGEPVDTPPAG